MNSKRILSVICLIFVVLLVGACSAQPGEMTLGQMAAQANQTAPATSVPSTPTPHVVIVTATPEAPTVHSTAQPTSSGCATDSEVMSLFGFGPNEIIRTDSQWDSCKWTRQNAPSTITFVLHEGWGLTYTDAQGAVWVTMGVGQQITARGFTLRQPGNQLLAEGPTGYFNREWTFGFAPERGTRTYAHCPDSNMAVVTLTDEQSRICTAQGTPANNSGVISTPVPMATRGATVNNDCPTTTAQVAQMVGGSASNWTAPDWDGGAWVFDSGTQFVTLRVPVVANAIAWIDYWGGDEARRLSPGQSLSLSHASFHCHAQ